MSVVLDTSALLALLWNEPGSERVTQALSGAKISAVNVTELVSKLIDRGASQDEAEQVFASLGLDVVDFGVELALEAGYLRTSTRSAGLSVGDRACLALAISENATVYTADRVWAGLGLAVEIELVR